jgi:peptidyl-prolyl cis-trans isomerase C
VQDFIENNPVSPEMVQAEYERIKATIEGNEYKASHILVETEAEAKEIIGKLNKDPGTFAKLAKERSKDSGSAPGGGDLGWFDMGRMVPEFSTAVSKLEKGKFTQEPVQTQFGYHVILLEDVKPIEIPPLEAVAPQLAEQLEQQNWEKQMETLRAAATIEIAGAPAPPAAPEASAAESEATPTE